MEWQANLYINFIDFEKAFDSVHRESLWLIMRGYGIPSKLINLVKALYNNFECAVVDSDGHGDWFPIQTGVKQGCNMSGFLFLLVIDHIMKNTTATGRNGIRWNLTTILDDLDFADDIALLASTKQHLQNKTDKLVEEAAKTGLKINTHKSKVMRFNARNHDGIEVNGNKIDDVDSFTYLGAKMTKEGGGKEDIDNRLAKARAAFNRLKRIWQTTSISQKTKLKLYKTLVRPVLLYGSETWKMNVNDNRRINVFESRCLRRILRIRWEDRITNDTVIERAGVDKLSTEIKRRRWKFIGHVLRKSQDKDCAIALSWQPEGKRKVGRPKTTWRRTVVKEREDAGWKSWSEARVTATDRTKWRSKIEALCASGHAADR